MADSDKVGQSAPTRTELVWPGKRTQVERVALPFQVVETFNQSRATREQTPLFAGLPTPPLFEGQATPWTNKLIWGENKYVLASLLHGDPSIGLEPLAGKVDLIYIDPPFATGQDFSYRVEVGDEEWTKQASAIEEKAYRDTWGGGLDSYLQMMHDRLALIRELLAEDGSVCVHCDWRVVADIRSLLNELFGRDNLVNEIIWQHQIMGGAHGGRLAKAHETVLWFAKSPVFRVNTDDPNVRVPFSDYVRDSMRQDAEGRWYYTRRRMSRKATVQERESKAHTITFVDDPSRGTVASDVWGDLLSYQPKPAVITGYPTQKPDELLERIVGGGSKPGDLIADFFCGSGTTMAVAEKLGRRWIGCDLSRYAIQVSRKRLLDIPGCKPFQVLNLGSYERKHWQVNVLNGKQEDGTKAIADYYRFILALYHAEPAGGYKHLHGAKMGRWVHVGPVDAPVTRAEVMDALRECQAHRYTGLDVLGWEWEMGLHDTFRDEARRMGVDLSLLYIPCEVMDKRVKPEDVRFFELAFLKTAIHRDGRTATVRLEDFIIPNPDLVPDLVRSKIKKWSDYIDFWAVDWDYQGDTFRNQWQAYRTRKNPTLRLLSDPHPYPKAGKYSILVKVIDIFGNDTTQLHEIAVP